MAENSSAAEKYEEYIRGIPQAEEWLKNKYVQRGLKLESHGWCIDSNGELTSWGCITSDDDNKEDNNINKSESKNKNKENKNKENKKTNIDDITMKEYQDYLSCKYKVWDIDNQTY